MSKRRNLLDSAEKRRSLQNVAVARGRLKGALQDIVTHSDDDSDSEDLNSSRLTKRPKTSAGVETAPETIPIPHQSYIMKLFDRSVDLARFDENTPLYSICRAWMQNQPRLNPNRILRTPSPVKREHNPEMAEQYRNQELKEIRAMPKPDAGAWRCPSPLRCQRESSKDRIDLEAAPLPKAILMAEHKQRWGQIRRKWQEHGRDVEERHAASFALLDAMQKREMC